MRPKNLVNKLFCRCTDKKAAGQFTLAEGATHVALSDSQRKCAFTLAEVLITLGIIGVVSAVTLPTLIKRYQRQVYVTQVQKVYNQIQQAIDLYITENNLINLGESRIRNNPTELRNFVNNYFKVVRDCETRYLPCFPEEYTSLNGGKVISYRNGMCNMVVTLTDGTAMCLDVAAMEEVTDDDDNVYSSSNVIGGDGEVMNIEFDINGQKGPNVFGRDAFVLSVDRNGQIYDRWYVANGNDADLDDQYITNGTFGKIMNDGWKMEY